MSGALLASMQPRRRLLGGRGTLEISGYPWLTPGAILALEQILRPHHRVLELGSGGSTLFFARRVAHVRSFETDPGWAERVYEALDFSGVANVNLTCAGLDGTARDLGLEPDASYDVILVDHKDPSRSRRPMNRLRLAKAALPKLKPEGWLVVDNYAILGMQRFDTRGWDIWTFDDLDWSGRGTRMFHRGAR